jgi:DNA-binding NarL/FixJ family response regulator
MAEHGHNLAGRGAERELRRLGHRRVHHRSARGAAADGGIGALTARELQVARLVTDRRTNAEIAAELYLSTKTVETHIRNLFQKLAVTSRVEVARAVERHDRQKS